MEVAKKQPKAADSITETGVKLEEIHYWKWRLTLEEVQHSQSRAKIATLNLRMKELEAQNCALQCGLLKTKIKEAAAAIEASKKEYDRMKGEIEEKIGISLNDSIIDPYTYAVKRITKDIGRK